MNKVVIGLLVAVCLLGFALILLNERMGAKLAPPVVADEVQSPLQRDVSADMQPPHVSSKASEISVSEDNHKMIAPNAEAEASEAVSEIPVQSEIVNKKALDEVLSERASEVQAPSQQASIVQQTSVTDLVVESPQLPKILSDMPIVSEPQVLESTPHLEELDIKEPVKKQPESVAAKTKAQDVRPGVVENKKNSQDAGISSKNDAKIKGVPKTSAEEKSDKAKTVAAPIPKILTVTLFTVFTRENGATVRLRTNSPIAFSSAQLQNPKALVKELQKPDRLMVDLTGAVDIKEPAIPNNAIVNKIRVGKMADRARIVVDLKEKPKKLRVKITEKKDGFDIFLDR